MGKIFFGFGLLVFIVSACAPAAPSATLAPTTAPQSNSAVPTVAFTAATVTAAPAGAAQPTTAPVIEVASARPAWHNITLTNARTGQPFTLADFAGKTVYVEPMATWCTNCRAQQREVVNVLNQLGTDEYVFLSVSVGEAVTDADLAAYAEREGYPWNFAIATPEMLAQLVEVFGFSVTTPPSTPHFTISPDGTTSDLQTGHHSADELIAELTQA